MMAPSPTSPATRSMPGRRAATWIGTGPATGRLRRKPSTESVRPENVTRSPASAARRTWTISRTRVAGRSNRPPFHASTMGCEPAPMPRQKRPGRDLGDARRARRERGGAAREDVGDRRAHAHAGGGADHGQRREAVDVVHLERPRVRVAEPLGLAGQLAVLGEEEAVHRHRHRPALRGHASHYTSGAGDRPALLAAVLCPASGVAPGGGRRALLSRGHAALRRAPLALGGHECCPCRASTFRRSHGPRRAARRPPPRRPRRVRRAWRSARATAAFDFRANPALSLMDAVTVPSAMLGTAVATGGEMRSAPG